MFAKVKVNGDDACDLYEWLKSEQPGDGETSDIVWNFEKFLVSTTGEVLARFGPLDEPEKIAEDLPGYLSE